MSQSRNEPRQGIALQALLVIFAILPLAVIISSSATAERKDRDFNVKTYKGQVGKIAVSHKGEAFLRVRDVKTGDVWRLQTKNGVFQCPAGTFTLLTYDIRATDRSKTNWYAYCTAPLSGRKITVSSSSSRKLLIGPPFTASVDVRPLGSDKVSLSFKLTDQNGDSYVMREDSTGKTPGFKVLDSKNKVVWSGSFQYG